MTILFTYSSLVVASLAVIALFVTSRTYPQLAVASALYPLLVYLIYKVLPHKSLQTQQVKSSVEAILQPVNSIMEEKGFLDIDKRNFLKMVGAAGISFFLFSILNKRGAIPLFSPSGTPDTQPLPGTPLPGGEPTDGYRISEIDDSDIIFYGFTNTEGGWFIMKEDDEGSFRYAKGKSDFPGNWTKRQSLSYDYYHKVF